MCMYVPYGRPARGMGRDWEGWGKGRGNSYKAVRWREYLE